MTFRAWVCEGCKRHQTMRVNIWDCPGCGRECCEHCFSMYAHCKPCCVGKSATQLIEAANMSGCEFCHEPEHA